MRRERTNTPLQALLLMNDPQFFEPAMALAARTLRDAGPSDNEKAEWLLCLCLCRQPTSAEIRDLVGGVVQDLEHYRANPKAAEELLQTGNVPALESMDPAQLAAWTMAANTLLNLDEFLNKN